ncbi:MAG: methionyl-tRNA formyltransferase [Gammaproteobacteria bacterium]|nr:methionyl-tRNA formyltransferase [Gammaproteobacteria bacterium]
MKIIFAGTPAFSVPTLEALLGAGHSIKLVLTQPDRPTGRGQKVQFSPVKSLALKHGLPILQPSSLKSPDIQALLKQQQADVMVVIAYGLLLPEAVLTLPLHGCINVHASLLPRWRGAAPISYAILAGDQETGVTIMKMDKGLDTGDMILTRSCPISPEDTSGTLQNRLAHLGAEVLIKTLENLQEKSSLPGVAQDPTKATHASKITKEDARLQWTQTAAQLERKVRAFNPWPIAHFPLIASGESVRVWQARALPATVSSQPGTLLEVTPKHLYIACAEGIFSPEIVQFPGKTALPWSVVFNARRHLFVEGTCL